MRVLLISTQGIGDIILVTPAIKYLHKQGCHIDMVCSDNGSHQIIEALGLVDKLFIYKEKHNYFRNIFRLLQEIYASKYEKVYAMYPNGKRENILSFLLSKKNRGWAVKGRNSLRLLRCLIRDKVYLDESLSCHKDHYISNNLALVKADESSADPSPLIVVPQDIQKEADKTLHQVKKDFFLLVHPFSKLERKCWSLENFKYVCRKLLNEKYLEIVVAGSPSEEKSVDEFISDLDQKPRKFVRDNILSAAAVINDCGLFFGNDSSLLHIAASLNKPAFSIYGFSELRRVIYGKRSIILSCDFKCSPCYNFENPLYKGKGCSDIKCLRAIDKEIVFRVIAYTFDKLKQGENIENIDYLPISGVERTVVLCYGSRELVLKKDN
ncbi:MAG: glycosyltransferase family 9 protein [Candidatus Omnitrophica bacterium]|nr:glycosyltransferase family 9 protein [Candidatus Omnitrophota bacterium]